jgi:Fe-S cluster biogenesis protein NfuA
VTTTTNTVDVRGAIDNLRGLVQGDGADLTVISIDNGAGVIELALELVDANCAECMLPPARLREVLASSLAQQGVTTHRLVLRDPRGGGALPGEAERIMVLDPTATIDAPVRDAGPDAGPLAGKTVFFRIDALWTSWDIVSEEWQRMLTEAGAQVTSFRRVQGLAGADAAAADREYARLLSEADVAVVGLGNCGSCTSWTIKDAASAATTGMPTTAVVTEQFAALAGTLSGHYQRPGLRTQVLPFPLQNRPEDEVRSVAVDYFPALLETLGATV